MPDLSDFLDVFGRLRYGMPTSEKEALASSHELPGAPPDPSEDQAASNRYASGYLFARQHPTIAPTVMPAVNRIRLAWFGDSPELQSYAIEGMNRALTGNTTDVPKAAMQAAALRRAPIAAAGTGALSRERR